MTSYTWSHGGGLDRYGCHNETKICTALKGEGVSCGEEGGFLTAIDTKLTEVLIKEGIARELVRSVQEARKKSGFDVSDRIILGISGSEIVESVIGDYRDYIMNETLATEWQVGIKDPIVNEANSLDDASWLIEIKK